MPLNSPLNIDTPFPAATNKQTISPQRILSKMRKTQEKETHPPLPTQTRFPLICTLPSPSKDTTTALFLFTRPPSNKTEKSAFKIAHGTLSLFFSVVPGCATGSCTTKLHSPPSSDGRVSG